MLEQLSKFDDLPLVIEGESKEIRYIGNGKVAIRLKPTVYSYTHNRAATIPGSEIPRLRSCAVALRLFDEYGIRHAYDFVNMEKRLIVADLLQNSQEPFIVPDSIDTGLIAPPLEVVVKRFHMGTPAHRLNGLDGLTVRPNHPFFANMPFDKGEPYPTSIVRFDWRNPMHDADGNRLCDEAIPDDMADLFLDRKKTAYNARQAFSVLAEFLASCNVLLCDMCFFYASDGITQYGEISPDCGRFRHFSGSLDKDVWRAGGSSDMVLEKWNMLADLMEKGIDRYLDRTKIVQVSADIVSSKIYIGTTNRYKVREMLSVLSPYDDFFRVSPGMDIIEDGASFEDNAFLKANATARRTGCMSLGEDSGLCVDGLNGLPDIYSHRFARCELDNRMMRVLSVDDGVSDDDTNNAYVLKLLAEQISRENKSGEWMKGKHPESCKAKFVSAVCLVDCLGKKLYSCIGESRGFITPSPKGKNGFGYDPIFIGEDTYGLTYAELNSVQKELVSFRTKALRKMRLWMQENLFHRNMTLDDGQVVTIDGIDGTGKTSVCEKLRKVLPQYVWKDRGLPTEMTLDITAVDDGKLHIILDCSPMLCQTRLMMRGADMNEYYHTMESLATFRDRFFNIAHTRLSNCFIVDASGSVDDVVNRILHLTPLVK